LHKTPASCLDANPPCKISLIPAPTIDFTTQMVVAVFGGGYTTGGYTIEVSRVKKNGSIIEAEITNSSPGSLCAVTGVMTQPYHMVSIPKHSENVVFETMDKVNNCSQILQITKPSSFTLNLNETAEVTNYQNIRITVTDIRIPKIPQGCGQNGLQCSPPAPPSVTITTLSPGGCGPNAHPECLGPPGISQNHTIVEGDTVSFQGLTIHVSKINQTSVDIDIY